MLEATVTFVSDEEPEEAIRLLTLVIQYAKYLGFRGEDQED